MWTRPALNFGHQSVLITSTSPSKLMGRNVSKWPLKFWKIVGGWFISSRLRWHFINALSSPPLPEHRHIFYTRWLLSPTFVQFFRCFYYLSYKEAPCNEPEFCVSACIWADLWVLLSPQPQTGLLFSPHGWWRCSLHHHWSHHLVPFTLTGSFILLCSLLFHRGSKGGVSSSVQCLHVALSSLVILILVSFCLACFSRRHCCCRRWRWRGEGEPAECRCPALYEYVAWGRDRWRAAAHPHGPPCDTPGSVEWRPGEETLVISWI